MLIPQQIETYPYNIYSFVDETSYNFIVDNKTIFDSNTFSIEIKNKYFGFLFLSVSDNLQDAKNQFIALFNHWKSDISYNVKRYFDALELEYSPIENYDRKEEGGYTDAHHKGSKTSNSTHVENVPSGKTRTTEYINGYNSNEATQQGYVENESIDAKTTTTANVEQNYTMVEDISENKYDKDIRTYESYRIHGNIGVTTNMQMLREEIDLRKKDYVNELIESFIKEYCFEI